MKNIIYIIILIGTLGNLQGQDFHMSQQFDDPMLMNPALTGRIEEAYRAHLMYRNQWRSVIRNSYVTESFSIDRPWEKFGFGLLLNNDKAGTSQLNAFEMKLSSSYEVTHRDYVMHHLICGVQAGFIQKSISVNDLNFGNQYSAQGGGMFDTNIGSGEEFANASDFMWDVSFGLHYHNLGKEEVFTPYMDNYSRVIPFYVGVHGKHLTQPKETFLGSNSRIPMKIMSYIGGYYRPMRELIFEVRALHTYQAEHHDIQAGLVTYYYHPRMRSYAFAGVDYRLDDAVIISIGAKYQEYSGSISYDVNMFNVNPISRGRGGFEIHLAYELPKKLYKALMD